MTDSNIHSTAIISKSAEIGEGTSIGPYSVIGDGVKLGKGNWIGPHVVIEGNTSIGDENKFFQFASIGAEPQDLKFKGEDSRLEIGDGNIVREYVTIQPGTEGGGMLTKVGNQNLFMACSHLGHDGIVGNSNVFANSAGLSGHVIVGDYVTVGGMVGVHQFVRLGDHSLLGGGAMVVQDIPPFCIAQGDRARVVGVNSVGLERRGFSAEDISAIKKLYKALFISVGSFKEKLEKAKVNFAENQYTKAFIDFVSESERGIAVPRSK